MVTGSVADSVAPTAIASTNESSIDSIGSHAQTYNINPNTTADMKVPAKAKVKIVPIFLKKLA